MSKLFMLPSVSVSDDQPSGDPVAIEGLVPGFLQGTRVYGY